MAVAGSAAEALAAIRLGATHLQLRAPELSARRLLEEASQLASGSTLPVLVNDRVDVAALTGAGVHLPERGLPVAAARRLLGSEALIGRSVHGPPAEAALAARGAGGADYLIYGPIWATPSHPGRPGLGLRALAELAASVSIPVLAIGGAGPDRLEECLAAGAAGYAAIGAFRT